EAVLRTARLDAAPGGITQRETLPLRTLLLNGAHLSLLGRFDPSRGDAVMAPELFASSGGGAGQGLPRTHFTSYAAGAIAPGVMKIERGTLEFALTLQPDGSDVDAGIQPSLTSLHQAPGAMVTSIGTLSSPLVKPPKGANYVTVKQSGTGFLVEYLGRDRQPISTLTVSSAEREAILRGSIPIASGEPGKSLHVINAIGQITGDNRYPINWAARSDGLVPLQLTPQRVEAQVDGFTGWHPPLRPPTVTQDMLQLTTLGRDAQGRAAFNQPLAVPGFPLGEGSLTYRGQQSPVTALFSALNPKTGDVLTQGVIAKLNPNAKLEIPRLGAGTEDRDEWAVVAGAGIEIGGLTHVIGQTEARFTPPSEIPLSLDGTSASPLSIGRTFLRGGVLQIALSQTSDGTWRGQSLLGAAGSMMSTKPADTSGLTPTERKLIEDASTGLSRGFQDWYQATDSQQKFAAFLNEQPVLAVGDSLMINQTVTFGRGKEGAPAFQPLTTDGAHLPLMMPMQPVAMGGRAETVIVDGKPQLRLVPDTGIVDRTNRGIFSWSGYQLYRLQDGKSDPYFPVTLAGALTTYESLTPLAGEKPLTALTDGFFMTRNTERQLAAMGPTFTGRSALRDDRQPTGPSLLDLFGIRVPEEPPAFEIEGPLASALPQTPRRFLSLSNPGEIPLEDLKAEALVSGRVPFPFQISQDVAVLLGEPRRFLSLGDPNALSLDALPVETYASSLGQLEFGGGRRFATVSIEPMEMAPQPLPLSSHAAFTRVTIDRFDPATGVAVTSPDSRLQVAVGFDEETRIWSGTALHGMPGSQTTVRQGAAVPYGGSILYGSQIGDVTFAIGPSGEIQHARGVDAMGTALTYQLFQRQDGTTRFELTAIDDRSVQMVGRLAGVSAAYLGVGTSYLSGRFYVFGKGWLDESSLRDRPLTFTTDTPLGQAAYEVGYLRLTQTHDPLQGLIERNTQERFGFGGLGPGSSLIGFGRWALGSLYALGGLVTGSSYNYKWGLNTVSQGADQFSTSVRIGAQNMGEAFRELSKPDATSGAIVTVLNSLGPYGAEIAGLSRIPAALAILTRAPRVASALGRAAAVVSEAAPAFVRAHPVATAFVGSELVVGGVTVASNAIEGKRGVALFDNVGRNMAVASVLFAPAAGRALASKLPKGMQVMAPAIQRASVGIPVGGVGVGAANVVANLSAGRPWDEHLGMAVGGGAALGALVPAVWTAAGSASVREAVTRMGSARFQTLPRTLATTGVLGSGAGAAGGLLIGLQREGRWNERVWGDVGAGAWTGLWVGLGVGALGAGGWKALAWGRGTSGGQRMATFLERAGHAQRSLTGFGIRQPVYSAYLGYQAFSNAPLRETTGSLLHVVSYPAQLAIESVLGAWMWGTGSLAGDDRLATRGRAMLWGRHATGVEESTLKDWGSLRRPNNTGLLPMLLGRAQQRWDADDRWTGAGYLGLATGLEVLTTFGTMWSLNKVIRGAELAAASAGRPHLAQALAASNQYLVIAPFYLQLAQQGATVAGQVVESVKTGDRSRIKTADWMSLASSTAGLLAASGALRGVSTMSSNLRYNRAVKRGDISGETRPIFHDVGRTVWEGVATEAKRLTTISTGSLVGAGLGGEPLAVMVTGGALTYAASAQLAQQRALSEASGRLNILARGPSAEGYNPAGAWLHEHFRVPSIDQIRQGGEDVTLTARVPRLARWLGVTPGTIGVRADVLQKLHYDSVISSPED
ncbi:MAG TPA: hypothetical protein DDX89_09065, partial [Candidatus Omnitrophica bacterium]|nr:hypothetical protein [Candidatus Omnitrophota bacterium]